MFVFALNEACLSGLSDDETSYDDEERREQELWEAERRELLGTVREEYLDLIPPVEADIIELLYADNSMTQARIGLILGITQAAVSHRIGRAINRIRYLHERPKLTAELVSARIAQIGESYGCDEIGRCAELMGHLWDTTCESETAKHLGWTQSKVLGHLRLLVRELQRFEPEDEITIWLGRMLDRENEEYYKIGVLHESPIADRWASKRARDPYAPTPEQLAKAHAVLERQKNRSERQASISGVRVVHLEDEDRMEDAK